MFRICWKWQLTYSTRVYNSYANNLSTIKLMTKSILSFSYQMHSLYTHTHTQREESTSFDTVFFS